jgi:VanZ family protein
MRDFLIYWVPALGWMGLIYYLSTGRFSFSQTAGLIEPLLLRWFKRMSTDGVTRAHMKLRAIAHFVEYLVLSLLVYRAVRAGHPDSWESKWMRLTLVITIGYAIADELHQKWEWGRTPRVKHVVIDVSGICAGQFLVFLVARFWGRA